MSDWKNCPNCKEYDYFGASAFMKHRCKPAWECRLEWHKDDPDAWERIHAADAEAAAEKFAEQYDCDGGEYAIVGGRYDECIVQVRKPMGFEEDEEPVFERWAIEAETVPQYRASKVE